MTRYRQFWLGPCVLEWTEPESRLANNPRALVESRELRLSGDEEDSSATYCLEKQENNEILSPFLCACAIHFVTLLRP